MVPRCRNKFRNESEVEKLVESEEHDPSNVLDGFTRGLPNESDIERRFESEGDDPSDVLDGWRRNLFPSRGRRPELIILTRQSVTIEDGGDVVIIESVE